MLVKWECTAWRGIEMKVGGEAICFSATGVVQEVYVDSTHSVLYALLRDSKRGNLKHTGYLVAYDLNRDRQLWSKPFHFTRDRFFLSDTVPVMVKYGSSYGLDRYSGEEVWERQFEIDLVTKRGVGLGKEYTKEVVGVNLQDGKDLWRKTGQFDDIESFEIHGDTAAVFLRKGLNFLDLQTGQGFRVEAKTLEAGNGFGGANIGAAVAAGIVGGLIGGLVVGVAVVYIPIYTGDANQRADNSLTDIYRYDDDIFFTSKSEIYKVNLQGEIVWQEPIAKAIGFSRKVFVAHDAVFLISKGVLPTSNGPLYSDAVLYRKNVDGTGPILGMQLNTGAREYVKDFLIKDSTIIVALNNKLRELRLDDLTTVREVSFGDVNQHAGFGAILNPPAILLTDSVFESAQEKYPGDFYVENIGGMKIRFSEELAPVEAIREKNYFSILEKTDGGRMFITNGQDVYLVDSAHKKVKDVSFTPDMKKVGTRIFDFDDDRILMMNLY